MSGKQVKSSKNSQAVAIKITELNGEEKILSLADLLKEVIGKHKATIKINGKPYDLKSLEVLTVDEIPVEEPVIEENPENSNGGIA